MGAAAPASELEAALARLEWRAPRAEPDDWPWLLAWQRSARGRAAYLLVGDAEPVSELVARVREALRPRRAVP